MKYTQIKKIIQICHSIFPAYFSNFLLLLFLVIEPTMDIHRCRFSEWMPSAACAVTFHPELPLLVVGRENGNIELWNTEEKWFCEAVV